MMRAGAFEQAARRVHGIRRSVFDRYLLSRLTPLGIAWVMGCSPELGTPSPDSITQIEEVNIVSGPSRVTYVLVVDDGPEEAAVRLRQAVLQGARSFVESQVTPDVCASYSPLGSPIDVEATVVHPSALDGQGLVLSTSTWRADTRRVEDAETWLSGIEQALAETAPADGEYALAQATRRAWDLALGLVPARNDAERSFALSDERIFLFLVATTRDDSGRGDVTQYQFSPSAFELDSRRFARLLSVITPDVADGECSDDVVPPPRLQAWINRIPTLFRNSNCPIYLDTPEPDCYPQCRSRVPLVDANGTAECRITVLTQDASPCDAKFGRIDPLSPDGVRRPRMAETRLGSGELGRECEVQQLEGEALRSCIEDPACAECSPGWCATGPSVLISDLCREGQTLWPIRFTGGADRPGEYRSVCNTEAAIGEPLSSVSP